MKILIGNRGEIACRIIKTCKRLGFETVGIYTPADKFSKHVKEVDFSIALPSGPLKENYLNLDLIIQGAIDLDVKAVHPGYGFFSESAEACLKFEKAGITWIGPTYRNIRNFKFKTKISYNVNEIFYKINLSSSLFF